MSEELFEKYMLDRLSEEEKGRLAALLRDPEAKAAFVAFTQEWSMLAAAARRQAAHAAAEERQRLTRASTSPATWVWVAAAVAALLLMVLLPYAFRGARTAPPPKMARDIPVPPAPERPPAPSPVPAPSVAEAPIVTSPPAPPPPNPAPPAPPPAPVPAPAPPPAPPPSVPKSPASPPTVVELPVLARARALAPGVRLVDARSETAVKDVEIPIRAGAAVETAGGALALVRLTDGTLLSVAAESRVEFHGPGRIDLARGSLLARVATQPRGSSLTFATAHAEAAVLGTSLSLSTSPAGTRLEVSEGKVRFTRRSDGMSLDVPGGRSAEAGQGAPWQTKPLLALADFQDGGPPFFDYAGTSDAQISEVEPERRFGREDRIEVDGNEAAKQSLWVLLRWDLSSIPRTSIVHEASLTLHVDNTSEGQGFQIFPLLRPWAEEEVTWTHATAGLPWKSAGTKAGADRAMAAVGSFRPATQGPLSILLPPAGVAVLQAWVRNPAANHGVLLHSSGSTDGARFASREHRDASRRPKLSVRYVPGAK